MAKFKNPVAKFAKSFNKAVVFKDRKREAKKTGDYYEENVIEQEVVPTTQTTQSSVQPK